MQCMTRKGVLIVRLSLVHVLCLRVGTSYKQYFNVRSNVREVGYCAESAWFKRSALFI